MPAVIVATVQVHIAIPGSRPGEWQFLLLKRSLREKLYPGIWQVVTGRVEQGETALQAAARELCEETGFLPNRLWVLPYVGSFFDAGCDAVNMIPSFGYIAPSRDVCLSREHEEAVWLPAEQALRLLVMPSHREGTSVFLHSVLLHPEPVVPSVAVE